MNYYLKALRNYAVFDGRATRTEYWYFFLINVLNSALAQLMDGAFHTTIPGTNSGLFSILYGLALLLPSLAVGVRRIHDVGKSGWYILVPIYNIILFCTEGDKGDNLYGPDPMMEGIDQVKE